LEPHSTDIGANVALSVRTERVQIPIMSLTVAACYKNLELSFRRCVYEFRELLSGVGRIHRQIALRRVAETAVIPDRRH
jgi:hypothetical protein